MQVQSVATAFETDPTSDHVWNVTTGSAEETRNLGETLGHALRGGETLLLIGQLGAGKTTFTQGLAIGLDVDAYTKSPSFVLLHEHHGRVPLYHLDLFRIETVEEAWDLGLDEYLSAQGVMAVEWGDRARGAFPDDVITIEIEAMGEDRRAFRITAGGRVSAEALDRAKTGLGS